jgi:hypothetical protein
MSCLPAHDYHTSGGGDKGVWNNGGIMISRRKMKELREKKLLQCLSLPQISHWVTCELNLGLHDEKQACNHLSYKNQNYVCLEMLNLDPQTKFNRHPASGFRSETWWCPDTHILSVASNLSTLYNDRLGPSAVVVHLKSDKTSTVYKLTTTVNYWPQITLSDVTVHTYGLLFELLQIYPNHTTVEHRSEREAVASSADNQNCCLIVN